MGLGTFLVDGRGHGIGICGGVGHWFVIEVACVMYAMDVCSLLFLLFSLTSFARGVVH